MSVKISWMSKYHNSIKKQKHNFTTTRFSHMLREKMCIFLHEIIPFSATENL